MKPRLLDLFCGAGGAAMGYHRAGFDVVGVDIVDQPNFPFEFVQCDALSFMDALGEVGNSLRLSDFDAIHASPPCPAFSSLTHVSGNRGDHPDLVAPTRELLEQTGLPYVIENVIGAPLINAITLCGASFGLGATGDDGKYRYLRRHRLFEANFWLFSPGCACPPGEPVGVYGGGGPSRHTVYNGGTNRGYMGGQRERQEAMGIDWMERRELSNAIPPVYTEHIGHQLMAHILSANKEKGSSVLQPSPSSPSSP